MSRTVLVVDDSSDVRLVCRVNLEYQGYVVEEAENGDVAMEMIRKDPPDVVLLDVMMPGVDGWQVLETMKADSATAEIPVIMLTARTREADQIRGWRSGASDYIIKPFNPNALMATVHEVLDRGETREEQHDRVEMLRFAQKLIGEAEPAGKGTAEG